MKLPEEYTNVWITYETNFYVPNGYYGTLKFGTVKRRAFYSKTDGYYDRKDNWIKTPNGSFSVPIEWRVFNGSLLPHTFKSYPNVLPEDVIKWEYC